MYWQKTGQDQQASAVVHYQRWFGAEPLRLNFRFNFKFSFSIYSRWPGMTSNEFPVLRQSKTLCVMLWDTNYFRYI